MAQLSELKSEGNLKLLLYGDSGAGKTSLIASMPGPVHIADFDGKVLSAAEFLRKKNPEQLKQVTYENYTLQATTRLPAEQFSFDMGQAKKENPFPYKTIGLDSLTTFSDESMKYLIHVNPSSVIKRMLTKGVQMPVLQDYQMIRIWFKQVITALLALPCNVVVTAHIQMDKDELTGQIVRSPMLSGKLSRELPIYFGEVWRAYRDDKGEHWAQTQSDSKFTCRSQIPGLPNPVKLDWNEISKYINA